MTEVPSGEQRSPPSAGWPVQRGSLAARISCAKHVAASLHVEAAATHARVSACDVRPTREDGIGPAIQSMQSEKLRRSSGTPRDRSTESESCGHLKTWEQILAASSSDK